MNKKYIGYTKLKIKFGLAKKTGNEQSSQDGFEKSNMGWITIYITGRMDFRDEVRRRLESANLSFMPGNIGSSAGMDTHDLYWLDDRVPLRKFKRAIGSKLIWKYRLRFFDSLEAFIESQKNTNTGRNEEEDELFAPWVDAH